MAFSRRADAPQQPLHRLAQERWLREVVLANPALAGAASLARHEGPLPRPNVKDPWPAVAVGVGAPGRGTARGDGVVAVCSTGVDLDLVPFAADARLAADADADLVLVLPERDAHAVTRELAAALARPATVATAPSGWRELV